MNNWSYINYDTLVDSILKGNQSIQDPIIINNYDNTETKNVSFLNHLMNYDTITKDNLFEELYSIYHRLHKHTLGLMNNQCVSKLVHRIKDEWYMDQDTPLIPEKIIDYNYFKNNNQCIQNYKGTCEECDKIKFECENDTSVPYESQLKGSYPMERYVDSILIILKKAMEGITKNISETEGLLHYFRNVYLSLLLDISIKHKSLYYLMDEGNGQLPDNIHVIFLNYILMHNLFHKQTIQHLNYLHSILKDVTQRITEMNGIKNNIRVLSSVSKEEDKDDTVIDNTTVNSDTTINSDNESISDKDDTTEDEDDINEVMGEKVSNHLLSFY